MINEYSKIGVLKGNRGENGADIRESGDCHSRGSDPLLSAPLRGV